MRKYDVEQPYEKLKEFTRGKQVTKESVQAFIQSLDIPKDAKVSSPRLVLRMSSPSLSFLHSFTVFRRSC
jgi:hypothetical protein